MKLNGLEKYFETVNGEIIDFKQIDNHDDLYTPLMFSFVHNKENKLNLSLEQLDFLIKSSDLKQVNEYNSPALLYALENNKSENLNLTSKQLDYLFQNSNLKQKDYTGTSVLVFALEYDKKEELNITNKQWDYIIKNSDLSYVTDKENLIALKKVQSRLLNDEIISKINIKEEKNKVNKI